MAPRGVDLQVNGYRGVDFSSPDLTESDFIKACRGIIGNGTTAFLPTMVTSEEATYRRNLPLMAKVMASDEFRTRLLGFHIEGPFISPKPGAVGAHNAAWVRAPDTVFLDHLCEWAGGRIKLLTVAAEIPEIADLIAHARRRDINIALGHQLATDEDLAIAAVAGATALTHLGNGIPNELPRHPNPIWDGLAEDRLTMMVIADGHHLPAPTLKSMIRAKGADRTIIVSDASSLAGMPPGEYNAMGNRVVLELDGRLHNPDKKCLVGSSFTMRECMEFIERQHWYDKETLLKLGFYNPLALIRVSPDALP